MHHYIYDMRLRFVPLLLLMINVLSSSNAQRLDLFTSETDKIWNKGVAERVPYKETTGYFDYVGTDTKADTIVDGKPYYFLYFKVPYDVNEIGVRFITPVPTYAFGEPGDFETESYLSNKNDNSYFDPYVILESWEDSTTDTPSQFFPHWQVLGKNDDSDEVLAQPSGKRNNALLRVYADTYPFGIYRVRFAAAKKSEMHGTYLVHLATIPGIKRMKAGRTLKELEIER